MELSRLKERDQHYRKTFGNTSIKQFDVYGDQGEWIGKISDVLIDSTRSYYYLLVHLDIWTRARDVLLPIERFRLNPKGHRIDVEGLNKAEVDRLSPFTSEGAAPATPSVLPNRLGAGVSPPPAERYTEPYREQYRENYREPQPETMPSGMAVPPVAEPVAEPVSQVAEEQAIRLLEERLRVDRHKKKVGEVVMRKEIETEIVEVPVQREKLVLEQVGADPQTIAEVDLARGEVTSNPNFSVPGSNALGASRSQTLSREFHSAEAASQFLAQLAQQPRGYRSIHIQLEGLDPALQAQYQQWMDHYAR